MRTKRNLLKKCLSSREYRIRLFKYNHDYCFICCKRSGSFFADCSPSGYNSKGIHGSGKYIYTTKYREFKSWKHNRNKQWKT